MTVTETGFSPNLTCVENLYDFENDLSNLHRDNDYLASASALDFRLLQIGGSLFVKLRTSPRVLTESAFIWMCHLNSLKLLARLSLRFEVRFKKKKINH